MRTSIIRLVSGAAVGLSLLGAASVAQASSLTQSQISAILGLLQSFGADQSTINQVSSALGGSSGSVLSCSSFTDVHYGQFDNNPGGRVSQLQTWLGIPSSTFGFGTYGQRTLASWNARCGHPQQGDNTDVTLTATPLSGAAPLMVQFTMQGLNQYTPNVPYRLDFGDGSNSYFTTAVGKDTVIHTYAAGHYVATMVIPYKNYGPGDCEAGSNTCLPCSVEAAAGCNSNAEKIVAGPITIVANDTNNGFPGVSFTDTAITSSTFRFSFDPGQYSYYGYSIDFGDGSTMLLCGATQGCPHGGTTTDHGYTSSGTYTATLSALKTDGSKTVARTVTVQPTVNPISDVTNAVQIYIPASNASFAQDTYVPVTVTGSVSRQAYGSIIVYQKVAGSWQALPTQWPINVEPNSHVGPGSFTINVPHVIFTSNTGLTWPTPPGEWGLQAQMYTYGCGGSDCNPPINRNLATSDIVPITITPAGSTNTPVVSLPNTYTFRYGNSDWYPIAQLPDSQAFTASAWVGFTGPTCGVIFSDADAASDHDVVLAVDATHAYIRADKTGGSLRGSGCSPSGTYSIPLGTNISGSWHHLVWVNTGSYSTIYLDGVAVGAANMSGSNIGYHTPNQASLGRLFDGSNGYFPSGTEYFGGDISSFKYYNAALSASQVSALYNSAPKPPTTIDPSPTLSWHQQQTFNGTSDSVSLSPTTLPHAFTITALVNPTALTGQSYGFAKGATIVDADEAGYNDGSSAHSTHPGYVFGISDSGHLIWWPYDAGDVYSTGTVPLNKYTNVSVTYDGTNACFYMDSVLDSCHAVGAPGAPLITKVGAKSWAAGYFQGSINGMQIFSSALTGQQLGEWYKG